MYVPAFSGTPVDSRKPDSARHQSQTTLIAHSSSTSSGSNRVAAQDAQGQVFFNKAVDPNDVNTYQRLSQPRSCPQCIGEQATRTLLFPVRAWRWLSNFCSRHAKKFYLLTIVGSVLFILFAQLTMSFSLEYEAGITLLPSKENGSAFNYNMWDGMLKLWERGSYTLVLVIGLCSGLWPYVKALALLAAVDKRFLCGIDECKFNSVFFQLGKWSFIDVWVVIVAVLAVQVHRRISVFYIDLDATARQGIYLFFSATLLLHFVTTIHYCAVSRKRQNQRLVEEGITTELVFVRRRMERELEAEGSAISAQEPSVSSDLASYPPTTPVPPPASLTTVPEGGVASTQTLPDYDSSIREGRLPRLDEAGPEDGYIPTPSRYSFQETDTQRGVSTNTLIPQDQERSSLSYGSASVLTNPTMSSQSRSQRREISYEACNRALNKAILSLAQEDGYRRHAQPVADPSDALRCRHRSAVHDELAFVTRHRVRWLAFTALLVFSFAFFVAMSVRCFQIHIIVYQVWEYDDTYSVIQSLNEIWKRHETNAGLAFVFTMMVVIAPLMLYSLVLAFLGLRLFIDYELKVLHERTQGIPDMPSDVRPTPTITENSVSGASMTHENVVVDFATSTPSATPVAAPDLKKPIASPQGNGIAAGSGEALTQREIVAVMELGPYWRALWWIRETIWTLAQWSCLEGFVLAVFILGFELPLLLTAREKALVDFSLDKQEGLFTLIAICVFQLFGMQQALSALCPDTCTLSRILSLRANACAHHVRHFSDHNADNLPDSQKRKLLGLDLPGNASSSTTSSSQSRPQTDTEAGTDVAHGARSQCTSSDSDAVSHSVANPTSIPSPDDIAKAEPNGNDADVDASEFPEGLAEFNQFAFNQAERRIGEQAQAIQIEAMQEAMRQGARERARARARARAEEAAQAAANMTASGAANTSSNPSTNIHDEVVLQIPPRELRLDYVKQRYGSLVLNQPLSVQQEP